MTSARDRYHDQNDRLLAEQHVVQQLRAENVHEGTNQFKQEGYSYSQEQTCQTADGGYA